MKPTLPSITPADAGMLYRPRTDHAALDRVARTFSPNDTLHEAPPAVRKGVLLYQLRALADLMPPALASDKAFQAEAADIHALLDHARTAHEKSQSVDWAQTVRGRLSHLRNQAHDQCGAAQFGRAWKEDRSALLQQQPALVQVAKQAYPYYLVQHVAERIQAIGSTMLKDHMSRLEVAQYRHAMFGAIHQFRSEFEPLRATLPPGDATRLMGADARLQLLAVRPKEYAGIASELKDIVRLYNKQSFLRSDPIAPGVREESLLSSKPVDTYRHQRKAGPLPAAVAGESPLLDTYYTARWAKLARMMFDVLNEADNAALLNDATIAAMPDSHVVQEEIRRRNAREPSSNLHVTFARPAGVMAR